MRIILALSLLLASVSYCGEQPLIAISGGGSLNPSATNSVLEAAISYADSATNSVLESSIAHTASATNAAVSSVEKDVFWLNEACLFSDDLGETFFYAGTTNTLVLTSNRISFLPQWGGTPSLSFPIVPVFDVYSPVDTPVFIAFKSDGAYPDHVFDLVFTSSVTGVPVDFVLVVIVEPVGLPDKSAKTILFKLRRTF